MRKYSFRPFRDGLGAKLSGGDRRLVVLSPAGFFYLEESGFGRIEVRPLSPAVETMPALQSLPEEFRAAFLALDYAILGRKLR